MVRTAGAPAELDEIAGAGGTMANIVAGGVGAAELAAVAGGGAGPAALTTVGGAGAGTTTTEAIGACDTGVGASKTTATNGQLLMHRVKRATYQPGELLL